jgi:hypothetical protein
MEFRYSLCAAAQTRSASTEPLSELRIVQ